MNETGLAQAFGVFMPAMIKAVHTHFDCAISLHVVSPQRSGDEFASRFAANILLPAVCERSSAERDPP